MTVYRDHFIRELSAKFWASESDPGCSAEVVDGHLRLAAGATAEPRTALAFFNVLSTKQHLRIRVTALAAAADNGGYEYGAIAMGPGENTAFIIAFGYPSALAVTPSLWVLSVGPEIPGGFEIHYFEDMPALPFTLCLDRDSTTISAYLDLEDGGGDVLLHARTDFPERATFTAFNYQTDNPAASYVEFDDFVLETGDSANGEDLWDLLPVWLKTYPLAIGTDGDLALTPDGLTCFLQDVANVLDTEPGDLYAHANYGAGIRRFLGENSDEGLSRLTSQIRATLGDGAIRPRLDLANSSVVVTRASDTVTINTTIAAIAGDTVVTTNLILNYGINGIEGLWTSPATAVGTTTPGGPDGYLYPSLGRDLFLDRGTPHPNPSDRENLPQWHIVEGIGKELDESEDWFRRMRLNFFPETADEDSLVIHGKNMDVYRLADESLDDFRARVMGEWDQKKKDGTVPGIIAWFALYGFDASVTEGYSVVGPDDFPAAYWDELWVDATCVPGAVTIAPEEFFGRLYRRSRADRRVVFKSIVDGADPRRWGDGVWGDGWFWVESVFSMGS